MEEILNNFLDIHNFKASAIPASKLFDLENDIKGLLENGFITTEVYDRCLRGFSFTKPNNLDKLNSIIILSIPRPQHKLKVQYKDRIFEVIIPPQYVNQRKVTENAQKLLGKLFADNGFNIGQARLPYKLLSVRSGLAKYGKNNIAYVKDWGSFHQLAAFYSDWKISKDNWQELRSLDACKTCSLCLKQCPTGAISPNVFILDIARCLTYLNESKDDIPQWVSFQMHNSLVGCIKCQDICPYNKNIKDWIVDIGEMDQEETLLLLKSNGDTKNPKLIKKLQNIGLYEWFKRVPLGRNLNLLIDKF